MVFQSVPDTAEVFVEFAHHGIPVGMTFYFAHAGGYTETDIENLATAMDAWAGAEVLPVLTNQAAYVRTIARGLENEADYAFEVTTSAGPGTVTGNGMPGNGSFALKRLSGLTGRNARGRVYWPALSNSQVESTNENLVTSAAISGWLAALLEIVAYAITHGWIEVIVSRWNNNVKRATGVTFAVADWSFTDNRVDTQRRRLSTD